MGLSHQETCPWFEGRGLMEARTSVEDEVVVEGQEIEILVDQNEVPVEDEGAGETKETVDGPKKKRKLLNDGVSVRAGRVEVVEASGAVQPGASRSVESGAFGSVHPGAPKSLQPPQPVQSPQPLEFQASQVTRLSRSPWNLPPDFGVLSTFEDKRVGIATRGGWIRGALSERDNERLKRLSDVDLYHWMVSNAVQLSVLFAESLSRLEEKEKYMADLTVTQARAEDAQARAEAAEKNTLQLQADKVSLADAAKVIKETLRRIADDLAAEKRRMQDCEAALVREKKLTVELQGQAEALRDKNYDLVIRLGEAEAKVRKVQEESAPLRRDND